MLSTQLIGLLKILNLEEMLLRWNAEAEEQPKSEPAEAARLW